MGRPFDHLLLTRFSAVLHGSNLSSIANGTRVHPRVVGRRFRFDLGYDADASGARLLRGRARQWGRLARLWSTHPGELTKWAEASAWSLRGTHIRPQETGAPTVTDRVQAWERDTRTRVQHARTRLRHARTRLRHSRWRVGAEQQGRSPVGDTRE